MGLLYVIEIEPEVEAWLDSLTDREYGRVMAYAELLAEEAQTLGEPYARYLGDGVRELRIPLHPLDMRVSYWLGAESTGHLAHGLPEVQEQGIR